MREVRVEHLTLHAVGCQVILGIQRIDPKYGGSRIRVISSRYDLT